MANQLNEIALIPPSKSLNEAMQSVMETMREKVSVGLNDQFVDRIIVGDAPSPESMDNLNKVKNDNPVELLASYKGWSVSANTKMIVPSLFNNTIINQLTPVGGEVTPSLSFRFGYGVGVGYQWNKRTSVVGEYNYNQQGQTYTRASPNKSETLNLYADYHYLSALIQHQIFLPTNNVTLSLNVGPQIGILAPQSFRMEGDNSINPSLLAQTDAGLVGSHCNSGDTRRTSSYNLR